MSDASYAPAELATILGVSVPTLYRWHREGTSSRSPPTSARMRVVGFSDEIEAWLDERPLAGGAT